MQNRSSPAILIVAVFVIFAGVMIYFGLGGLLPKGKSALKPQPKIPIEELLRSAPLEDKSGMPGAYQLSVEGVKTVIRQLSERSDPLARYMLADLMYRNTPFRDEALKYYEDAVIAAPHDPLFLATYGRRALELKMPDRAVFYLRRLDENDKSLLAEAYTQLGRYDKVEAVAKEMLGSNPYSREGMMWLGWAYDRQGDKDRAEAVDREMQEIEARPGKPFEPVTLSFSPVEPMYHSRTKSRVGPAELYGHSDFSVAIKNRSNRPVQIDAVLLSARGTGMPIELGDIKDYWPFGKGVKTLGPGEARIFSKKWGFTANTGDQRMSYVFNVCWTGAGEKVRQCRMQRLDLLSDQNALQKYMPVAR